VKENFSPCVGKDEPGAIKLRSGINLTTKARRSPEIALRRIYITFTLSRHTAVFFSINRLPSKSSKM